MPRYTPSRIEPKWQEWWDANHTFASPRLPGERKRYILDMFPYPSGDGLHVGHPEGYTATDIVSRFERMRGTSVMHPMGFDAFGLPAEEHAIRTGTPPAESTKRNIDTFRRQLKMLGFSYDWSREVATTDPGYVRWTQWIFLVLFDTWFDETQNRGRPIAELPIPADVAAAGERAIARYRDDHRLAYQSEAPVNWCPALGTVLANEEVVGGVSERGSHPVVRIPLRQWMLRITAYADRLDRELEGLAWPESIKKLQRDWIGRSTGAEVDFFIGECGGGTPAEEGFHAWQQARQSAGFPAKADDNVLRVYTTRPDTLYGVTAMVVAPEHPAVDRLTTPEARAAVEAYREAASRKSDLDRTDLAREKSGVFTGSFCRHPLDGRLVPIWVADYVLASYGTGAIMSVPAHDSRDHEFAVAFGLEITPVIAATDAAETDLPFTAHGVAINSGPYNGLETAAFLERVGSDLQASGLGRPAVNYKLRDWLFSRQRFWGEPFPILHELDAEGRETGVVRPVPESHLPVPLPVLSDFKPGDTPDPPLSRAGDDWLYLELDGVRYRRETNTMPQWAGSCWYELRFLDPHNAERFVDPEVEKAWMPVDLYVGGAEHAVLHLLYARFWHKVLHDRGHVSWPEPFGRLVNQGMILGEMEFTGYRHPQGGWLSAEQTRSHPTQPGVTIDRESGDEATSVRVPAEQVEKQGEHFVLRDAPKIRVDSRAYKMSKSRGNVVNPDQIVQEFGADSLRLYEMFMGPLEATKPWSTAGVGGVRGFLERCWRLVVDERADDVALSPAVCDDPADETQLRELHRMLEKVTDDIESLSFNTAIAKMMEFVNFCTPLEQRPRAILVPFVKALAPFAPHLAEELWQVLGQPAPVSLADWPAVDERYLRDDTVEIPVQVQGKLRGRITVAAEADADAMIAAATADPRIAELLQGKTIVKTIAVPGRMVNFVVR